MEYQKRAESISLVVLCNIEPIFIHIKWMNERGIITGQELEETVNKKFTLSESQSVFAIGKDISVYCDRGRFQIESSDITAYQRIMDICRETLKLNRPSAFAAVGINAYMDFDFRDVNGFRYQVSGFNYDREPLTFYNEPKVLRTAYERRVAA